MTPRYKQKKPVKNTWHWSFTVMFIGIFIGLTSFAYVGRYTMVSWAFIYKAFVVGSLILLAGIPVGLYKKMLNLERWHALMFVLLGVAPMLIGGLLWLNFLFPLDTEENTYRVIDHKLEVTNIPASAMVRYTLEGGAFKEFPEYRTFELHKKTKKLLDARAIRYTTGKGLLGYPVMKDMKVIYE